MFKPNSADPDAKVPVYWLPVYNRLKVSNGAKIRNRYN